MLNKNYVLNTELKIMGICKENFRILQPVNLSRFPIFLQELVRF